MTGRDEGASLRLTLDQIYQKVESLDEKVDKLNVSVAIALQRQEDDRKVADRDRDKVKELEAATRWLQRSLYAIGGPLVLILGGWEIFTRWLL